jgi:hypothetical protein
MAKAIEEFKNKGISMSKCAKKHGIPPSTFERHLKCKNVIANGSKKSFGRRPVFSEAIETKVNAQLVIKVEPEVSEVIETTPNSSGGKRKSSKVQSEKKQKFNEPKIKSQTKVKPSENTPDIGSRKKKSSLLQSEKKTKVNAQLVIKVEPTENILLLSKVKTRRSARKIEPSENIPIIPKSSSRKRKCSSLPLEIKPKQNAKKIKIELI